MATEIRMGEDPHQYCYNDSYIYSPSDEMLKHAPATSLPNTAKKTYGSGKYFNAYNF